MNADDIPNAFNKHFIEIGKNLSNNIPNHKFLPDHYVNSVTTQFTFHEISPGEVLELLLGISPKKATGLDNISAKPIKLAAPL